MVNGYNIPKGYGVGMDRIDTSNKVAHLYKLNEDGEFGKPMCRQGWNRHMYGYSIFRGQVSRYGICKTCINNVLRNKEPVDYKLKNFNKLSTDDQKIIIQAMEAHAVELLGNFVTSEEEFYNKENMKNKEVSERLIYLINVLYGIERYNE